MFSSSVTFFPAIDNLGSGATASEEEYGIEGASLLSSMTQGFRGQIPDSRNAFTNKEILTVESQASLKTSENTSFVTLEPKDFAL